MAETFYIKQHDTRPKLRATLVFPPPPEGEEQVTLDDATKVQIVLRPKAAADPDPPTTKEDVDILTPATDNKIEYEFTAEDTATSGEFNGEFEVTLEDGGIVTLPSVGYFIVSVEDDLG